MTASCVVMGEGANAALAEVVPLRYFGQLRRNSMSPDWGAAVLGGENVCVAAGEMLRRGQVGEELLMALQGRRERDGVALGLGMSRGWHRPGLWSHQAALCPGLALRYRG